MIEVANKSDSSDEDYNERQPRSARKSNPRARKGVPKKRQRTSAHDSESELSDLSNNASKSSESEEDPNVERTARGTVKRGAARRAMYKDSPSGSEEDEGEKEENHDEDANEEDLNPPKSILVLKFPGKKAPSVDPTPGRVTRARVRSNSVKASDIAHATRYGTRRSTRLTHDETDDIVALSGSGRHIDTVRQGTRSPEATYRTRATSARATAPTVIPEEDEELEEVEHKPEIHASHVESQVEVLESDPPAPPENDNATVPPSTAGNDGNDTTDAVQEPADVEMADSGVIPESEQEDNDEDEEEAPRARGRTRSDRKTEVTTTQEAGQVGQEQEEDEAAGLRRSSRRIASKSNRKQQDEGSDFEPNEEEGNDEDISGSEASQPSPKKRSQQSEEPEESGNDRRSRLRRRQTQSRAESEADELDEELAELSQGRRRRKKPPIVYEEKPRRTRKSVDYRIIRPELALPLEDDDAAEPVRRPRTGGTWQRSLFSTYGPFGGAGGPPPLLGGPAGMGAIGGVESDSSDDESGQRPKVGAAAGITATTAIGQGLNLAGPTQAQNDATQTGLGKIKDRQALADSDPLGIDPNVNFDSVGGLQGHIDQLKEMVALPLLYPEIFQRFHIVPPRGVLFHGPPGTGKTLLARALASSVSSEGRKVTFYMRKGADALSKWVGEAERQLRLLFEEARKNQPSIIFFDEIDGKDSFKYMPNPTAPLTCSM